MHTNPRTKIRKSLLGLMLVGILLTLCSIGNGSPTASAQEAGSPQPGEYYTANTLSLPDGTLIEKHIINGPSVPPSGFEVERQAVPLPKSNGTTTNSIGGGGGPVYVLSCSATSAGDIAGIYDRLGYSNIYTGPTNGGVMPLDNSLWPTYTDVAGDTYSNNPLVASKQGVDGRTTRGTIDDYWVSYESPAPDPYLGSGTGNAKYVPDTIDDIYSLSAAGWAQHTWGDAIGDYMYSSQSAYGNIDGATSFYTYINSASPLTCDVMASNSLPDGTLGRKRFYETKGYSVGTCYNQPTDNVIAGGFSFAQFKAEIDAGRPVMLGLEAHSIVGIGYNTSSNQIYLHDGWDYDIHTMTWGGSYAGLALQDVSIVNLAPLYTISGNAGAADVMLSYTDGTAKTVTTDGSGNYSITVLSGWGGTVTPYKPGYIFTPVTRSYTNIQSNQTAKNYTAQVCVDCADVNVLIGGTQRGAYTLLPGSSTRQNYAGVDSGPVRVVNTGGTPIISAIRSAWAVNGVTTSFSQLMGLPLEQLSDTYVFPGYNNVTLNDQLRIANVDTVPTTVTVTIGGTLRGTYPLAAGAAVRINYPGLDSGPVVVQGTSGVKIISSIREAWAVNGVTKSFVQLMGLPAGQLSNKYVFPAYNNVSLNEQLRIGNVDPTQSTSVTVTIGGNLKGTYPLGPGQAVRINYPGLDSGPVIVEGATGVNIISSIRSAWAVNGVTTSFSQLMGMPAEQLSDKYVFSGLQQCDFERSTAHFERGHLSLHSDSHHRRGSTRDLSAGGWSSRAHQLCRLGQWSCGGARHERGQDHLVHPRSLGSEWRDPELCAVDGLARRTVVRYLLVPGL